jgi:putative ABC transport system permease protein
MRALDILILSWRQLKERRLRSILTMLAIAVGVTTIIALSAQAEGVKEGITESLGKLGPDTVIVTVQGRMPFTDADVARLRGLEGVAKVTPMLIIKARVTGVEEPVTLVGASSFDLVSFLGEARLLDGSVYLDVPAPQTLIGHDIAIDEAGQTRYKAGQPILVRIGKASIMMTVVGVLDTYGTSPMIQPDNTIFIPIDYVKTLVRGGGYTVIMVKAVSVEDIDKITELISYVFGGRARVTSIKQITETVLNVTSQVNLLLLGIASTSFIAAGLGTFNIMMISVLERVREIGILKALGMKDRGVLSLYMIQGVLIGSIGSLIGLALGCGVAYLIPLMLRGFTMGPRGGQGLGSMLSFTPVISPLYIGIATATSIIVTLLSSAYPAWRASRLRPVEALRYE